MMLFFRALVILGAVLAVISCGFAQSLSPEDAAGTLGAGGGDECDRIALSNWATVSAAGSTEFASTGAGQCL
jgi:hypothetical protein